MILRRTLALLACSAALLTACGSDDLPSKADFIKQVKSEMGSDLETTLTSTGIDKEDATKTIDTFIGCVYDKVKDNEELLRKAYDEAGDSSVQTELEKSAKDCTEALTKAMTSAVSG